jgi:hypothetical protein
VWNAGAVYIHHRKGGVNEALIAVGGVQATGSRLMIWTLHWEYAVRGAARWQVGVADLRLPLILLCAMLEIS